MARVSVVMPKMGESVMEGTVLEWKKSVGDSVSQDETLLEISTDKVDSEVPSPEAGTLVEILVQENDTVDVGTAIAVIETDGDVAAQAAPAESAPVTERVSEPKAPADSVVEDATPGSEPRAEAAQAEAALAAPSALAGGAQVEVVMPKMGESVMEGTVLQWAKAVGDAVALDETLLEISTDKVDSEVPSPEAGTLIAILAQEGDTVDVGAPIAVIAVGGGDGAVSASAPAAAAEPGPSRQEAPSVPAPSADPVGPIPRRDKDGNFYSPLVRSIAEAEGVSLSELQSIEGSGEDGRVSKSDLLAYVDARASGAPAGQKATPGPSVTMAAPVAAPSAPAPSAPAAKTSTPAAPLASGLSETDDRVEVIQMDRMRQLISEHMRTSKDTSAHVTSFAEVDVTGLVEHREAHKDEFLKREGVKLTYTPYFIAAVIEPLREHPLLNSTVDGNRIIVKKDFHIGIAVAMGTKGLLVPVVRNAGEQNLTGLTRSLADLAERTRTKKLLPDELQGGTFTLTNVGSLGSLMGTPIINQPQSAIVSPGAIVKRPMVMEDPKLGDVIAIRHMMYVSLSYDHRIIDGSMAASFLKAYRGQLEAISMDSLLF